MVISYFRRFVFEKVSFSTLFPHLYRFASHQHHSIASFVIQRGPCLSWIGILSPVYSFRLLDLHRQHQLQAFWCLLWS